MRGFIFHFILSLLNLVFYIYYQSQFRLDTFQVLHSHMCYCTGQCRSRTLKWAPGLSLLPHPIILHIATYLLSRMSSSTKQ